MTFARFVTAFALSAFAMAAARSGRSSPTSTPNNASTLTPDA